MTVLTAVRADITQLHVDAIVNAANPQLGGGGGVDGAIHRAGGPSIIRECRAIVARRGNFAPGQVAATGAGNLQAAHVLHAVGPIWTGTNATDADEALASCYRNALSLASELDDRTVAFPAISAGVYGFPADRAATIAVETVTTWTAESPDELDEVTFVCFDQRNLEIYQRLLS